MDKNLDNVMNKLRLVEKYPKMFKAAYGSEEITTAKFMEALSQFMLQCVSANSKYDKVIRKEDNQSFTADEQAGYALFKAKCSSFHSEPLFTDGKFHNNGLAPSAINDQ